MAAARSAVSFVCVVRLATPQARNTFYAASGQAGQGAEVQARKMLAALGICDVELVTWVSCLLQPLAALPLVVWATKEVFLYAYDVTVCIVS